MVAWCGAVLGELHATFVDRSPGGGRALPLVALLVAQPLAPLVALLVACWWWLVVGVLEW